MYQCHPIHVFILLENCRTIEGIQKHKQYELKNIYNEFKQYRLYEIITYNSKQKQILSRTLKKTQEL
jgi:hypothetical protein